MHAIRSLQNELSDAKRELVELRKENKLLNRIQIRQEKDLAKYVSSLLYNAPELPLYNMTSLFCFVLYVCTVCVYVCTYVTPGKLVTGKIRESILAKSRMISRRFGPMVICGVFMCMHTYLHTVSNLQ